MTSIFIAKYSTIENARKTGRGSGFVLQMIKSVFVLFLLVCVTGILSDMVCGLLLEDVSREPFATITVLYCEIFGIASGILYCVLLERRSVQSVGFRGPVLLPYATGTVLGVILITATVLVNVVCGGIRFVGFNSNANPYLQLLLLGGFMIQGMSEEVLFRGCIFVSLARKSNIPLSILGSSVLFSLIHVLNDGFSFIPFVNITLFGILEALLFLKTDNIWAAGAIHSIWNYMQGGIFGMNVSGNALPDTLFVFEQTDAVLLNGGLFGPEGGLVVTAIVLVAIVNLAGRMNRDAIRKTADNRG